MLKLNEIKYLLDNLPSHATVAITGSHSILTQMFNPNSAGTLFIKGEPINEFNSIGSADINELKKLLGQTYNMSYFEDLQVSMLQLYTYGTPYKAAGMLCSFMLNLIIFF